MTETIIKTTCSRDCYDSCGIHVVKKDKHIVRIVGDPEHRLSRGSLCPKCALAYNGSWRDEKQQLLTPLKRIGKKGAGSFQPISWENALSEITARLKHAASTVGPQSVLYSHYTGTLGLIGFLFPSRFFRRYGATEVDPDTICNKAGQLALEYVIGDGSKGFDPRTIQDSKCVVVWGANPATSAPHVNEHWLSTVDTHAKLTQ